MTRQDLIKIDPPGRADRRVAIDPEIERLLAGNQPVAIGVSGGKDSCAAALSVDEHLDFIGHTGPRVLIHSDLGRVEWADSIRTCERLARYTGMELIVVRRPAGDMMDRWLVRWANNIERYAELSCVKVILPWSTPAMRFCTSELKTAVIARALIKRFPDSTIISASGVRRDESPGRRTKPISKAQPKLTSKRHLTSGIDWNPIAEWTGRDVFTFLKARDFELHEAYTRYSTTRVSCAFCIMSSEHDLLHSTHCEGNHAIYREMVDLEIESTFAFQGDRWLGDVAPHLLTDEQRGELELAKDRGSLRQTIEAEIPDHLLYEEGWPRVMPTRAEAAMLARVRRDVARVLEIEVEYTTLDDVLGRYAELMEENERRKARR